MIELEHIALEHIRFQLYGATHQTAPVTLTVLDKSFPGRAFARQFGNYNWPPRSYEIRSADFLMCKFSEVAVLRQHAHDELLTHLCKMIIERFVGRLRMCNPESHKGH